MLPAPGETDLGPTPGDLRPSPPPRPGIVPLPPAKCASYCFMGESHFLSRCCVQPLTFGADVSDVLVGIQRFKHEGGTIKQPWKVE